MFNDFIYDIECYPNVFTFSAKHVATGQRYKFEISDRVNQIVQFLEFIEWCRIDRQATRLRQHPFSWIASSPRAPRTKRGEIASEAATSDACGRRGR